MYITGRTGGTAIPIHTVSFSPPSQIPASMATPLKLFLVAAFFLSINGNTVATKGDPATPPPEFRDHEINPLHHLAPSLPISASTDSPPRRRLFATPAHGEVWSPSSPPADSCLLNYLPYLLCSSPPPRAHRSRPLPDPLPTYVGIRHQDRNPSGGKMLTITFSNDSEEAVFVGGVKITSLDLYNDGFIAVHGLKGFIAHLSPHSCHVERMTSLSFPHLPAMAPFLLMRLMLKDAMLRLSISGYGVVSLALKLKSAELLELHAVTVFAMDDVAIFSSAGHEYLPNFRFHVVPNWLLMAADLEKLPAALCFRQWR